jgi:two-component system, response regulator PdtaR
VVESSQAPAAAAGTGSLPVVLVIEDDFWTRHSAAEALRLLHYRVIEACDAGEALSVLSSGVHVDAVFSDINMPGSLDGFAFAQWLGEHRPHIPVLLTSGLSQAASAMPPSPLRDFVGKPYDLLEVDRRLKKLLAG